MKKSYIKGFVILLILSLLVVIINVFGSRFIEKKIKEALIKNNNELFTSSVQTVKFNLLEREVNVVGFKYIPTDKAFVSFKQKDNIKKSLQKINISSFDIKGIEFYKLLFKNSIDVKKIDIEDVMIYNYSYPDSKIPKDSVKTSKLDSISLGKLNGLKIKEIEIENLQYQTLDPLTENVVLQLNLQDIDMGGFEMIGNKDNVFRIEYVDKDLLIKKVRISSFDNDYKLEIDQISRDHSNHNIDIDGVHLKPLIDKVELAKSYKYNKVVFDTDIEKITLFNYQIRKVLEYNSTFMDSILISGMNLDLYKDRRRPFNERLRPKFPNVLLNNMKDTLSIPKISVKDSRIYFEMVLEKRDIHLKLNLHDINADIENVYSMNTDTDTKLVLNYESKFMQEALLKVKLDFPYKDNKDILYMKGSIGSSKFRYFDSAIYPALGIKVLQGDLDGMRFNAVLGSRHAKGTMTMLYHDLEAEIFKKNSMEENRFLSWSVNRTLYNSNPVKGKPVRVALISADRTLYKGFINYIWVAVQSGIVNTLVPFGKTVAKAEKKAARVQNKKTRKKNRAKKKNDK